MKCFHLDRHIVVQVLLSIIEVWSQANNYTLLDITSRTMSDANKWETLRRTHTNLDLKLQQQKLYTKQNKTRFLHDPQYYLRDGMWICHFEL